MTVPVRYMPAVPDGPDRPWTRGRRTRWWLVVPADLVTVSLVALFTAASAHETSRTLGLLVSGVGSIALAWPVAWGLRRGRDHLEALWPEGGIVIGTTWIVWTVGHGLAGGAFASFAPVLAAFLVVLQAGWRCLYGYAKAHDSLVPEPVQRRLDAEENRQAPDRPVDDG